MGQDMHTACDRECKGFANRIRQERVDPMREKEKEILVMNGMTLVSINKMLDHDQNLKTPSELRVTFLHQEDIGDPK